MKDSTKVRLHLSKQLFESLTKQVITESKKNYGAGMEEVKGKHHGMKEVKKTEHDTKPVKEMETKVAEENLDESVLTDPNFIAGITTLLGGAGAVGAAIVKDLKAAQTDEEKKSVLQKISSMLARVRGDV